MVSDFMCGISVIVEHFSENEAWRPRILDKSSPISLDATPQTSVTTFLFKLGCASSFVSDRTRANL